MAVKVSGTTVIDNSRNASVNTLTLGGTAVTATATEINYLSGVTSAIQTQLDNVSVTNNTLTKSFIAGETATITLPQAVTSGAPVVSVTKEVPQTGVSNNNWDVATNGYNYERDDTAYNTALVPIFADFFAEKITYDSSSFSVSAQVSVPTSFVFNNDGTRFHVFNDASRVYYYNLSTAYDISTATYVSNRSFSTQDNEMSDLAFSSDGTKLFLVGWGNGAVYQYTLSTPFDISNLTYDSVSFSVASQATTPIGLTFNATGTKMYVTCASTDKVYQYSLSTAFDLSTASYDSVSLTPEVSPAGLRVCQFNADGTQLFTGENYFIVQYSLSTAYDLSTAVYKGSFANNLTLTGSSSSVEGIQFNPNNSKIYVLTASIGRTIYQHSIPNAESISLGTGSFASTDVGKTIEGNGGKIILIATDGTIGTVIPFTSGDTIPAGSWSMYATVFDETNGLQLSGTGIYRPTAQYAPAITNSYGRIDRTYWTDINSFTTDEVVGDGEVYYAFSGNGRETWYVKESQTRSIVRNNSGTWQYNTAVKTVINLDGVSFNFGAQETNATGGEFNGDGTKLYIIGSNTNTIYQYSLSTAYDISTASYDSVSYNDSWLGTGGIRFNNDGTKMYVLRSGDIVLQYSLSTPYNVSTASYDSKSKDFTSQESNCLDFIFNNDGTKVYIVGSNSDSVHQYSLSTAYDISTASYDSVSLNSASTASETTPSSIAFNGDGSILYVHGNTNDGIYPYNLSTPYDISTASIVTGGFMQVFDTFTNTILFNGDFTKLYTLGGGIDEIVQYSVNYEGFTNTSTWVNATTNTEFGALKEALSAVAPNRMNKTQLEAVGDFLVGAGEFGGGDSLDLMIALYLGSASASVPSSDGVFINYDANALNQGAVLGTDYDFDFPATNIVRITSNATQNLKVRVV